MKWSRINWITLNEKKNHIHKVPESTFCGPFIDDFILDIFFFLLVSCWLKVMEVYICMSVCYRTHSNKFLIVLVVYQMDGRICTYMLWWSINKKTELKLRWSLYGHKHAHDWITCSMNLERTILIVSCVTHYTGLDGFFFYASFGLGYMCAGWFVLVFNLIGFFFKQ